MGSMSPAQSMRRCFSRGRPVTDSGLWEATAGEERAQATVEAAVLLPSFLIVLLLALQPICLLTPRQSWSPRHRRRRAC